MRRLLPSRTELVIFAALAVLCTGIVATFHQNAHDLGFAAMAAPIFLVAACMGLRKSPIWTIVPTDVEDADETAD